MGTRTPWGTAQSKRAFAEGIVCYSTASHGGFKLSAARNACVPEALREAGGWYEEDCEAYIVFLSFPEVFPELAEEAKASVKGWYPDAYEKATGEKVAVSDSHVLQQRAAREACKERYVTVSAFGSWHAKVPEGFVGVCAVKGGRSEKGYVGKDVKHFLVPASEYEDPTKRTAIGFLVEESRHQEVEAL